MFRFIFVMAMIASFSASDGGWAKPLSRLQLREIEHLITKEEDAHLVTGYELGEVYWSQRVIKVLGVGTHMILSPTGGWGQSDLQNVAIQNAQQKIERLSAEVFRDDLEVSQCEWGIRSSLFRSQSPLWLSDGSVHLPSTIRFDIFEQCSQMQGRLTQGTKGSLKSLSNSERLRWLSKLENELIEERRAVIFARVLTKGGKSSILNCLSASPKLSHGGQELSQRQRDGFPNTWRAARWFWKPKLQDQSVTSPQGDQDRGLKKSLQSIVHPVLNLGDFRCHHRGEKWGLEHMGPSLEASSVTLLSAAQNEEGGAELWLWLDQDFE